MSGGPGAFLDRDGVLNELVVDQRSGKPESPLRVEDVRLVKGAVEAAGALARAGFTLVCVSNQPAAAKGVVSVGQLLAVHRRVRALLSAEGVQLAATRLCLHHPAGVVRGLSGPCICRKPGAGMLLDAGAALRLDLGHSWMVGDTTADVIAGRRAGCRTLLIECPGSAHKRLKGVDPDLRSPDLAGGVRLMLDSKIRDIRTS